MILLLEISQYRPIEKTKSLVIKTAGKFAEISDEYVWKKVLTTETRTNAALYAAIGGNAMSVLGVMGYGALTSNVDMVKQGFEYHLLSYPLIISLFPRLAEYRKTKKSDTL